MNYTFFFLLLALNFLTSASARNDDKKDFANKTPTSLLYDVQRPTACTSNHGDLHSSPKFPLHSSKIKSPPEVIGAEDGPFLNARINDAKKHLSFIINHLMEIKEISSTTASKIWKHIHSTSSFQQAIDSMFQSGLLSQNAAHLIQISWDGSLGMIRKNDLVVHDPLLCLEESLKCSHDPFALRAVRAIIYEQTKNASLHGFLVDSEMHTVSPESIQIMQNKTFVSSDPSPLTSAGSFSKTEIHIIDADTIDAAFALSEQGYKVVALNFANQMKVGGGVIRGAQAQEEVLFRRSTYFLGLDINYNGNLKKQMGGRYSIPEFGAVYTPSIVVIRGREKDGFPFIAPFEIDFIASAAYDISKKFPFSDQLEYFEKTKKKMRAILRLGKLTEHDAIVLGAYGCGAFKNTTSDIARLFSEVLSEEEFQCQFKIIIFAILNGKSDHKMSTFQETFEGNCKTPFAIQI